MTTQTLKRLQSKAKIATAEFQFALDVAFPAGVHVLVRQSWRQVYPTRGEVITCFGSDGTVLVRLHTPKEKVKSYPWESVALAHG